MASKPLLLEGEVDTSQQETEFLRDEISGLRSEVTALRAEVLKLRNATFRLWSPIYKALQPVFGDVDPVADFAEERSENRSAWDAVKQRLQPRHREVIDVLLLQGEMTRKQISSAIRMNYTNCTNNVIGPLLRQGWLLESGGKISLKQL